MTGRLGVADRGTATAEMAVVLPALAVVLVFALWSVAAVTAQLRCVDAAHTAARALARGETSASSVAAARAAAPPDARIVVSRSGDLVVVDVRATARLPGPWSGSLPGLSLSGRAVAPVEGERGLLGGGLP
jgi:Flp pilus assembly protein TadG